MKDKVVFITGGNSGIGAACARKFAAHGALVTILARRVEESQQLVEKIRDQGGKADFITADVRDSAALIQAINDFKPLWAIGCCY